LVMSNDEGNYPTDFGSSTSSQSRALQEFNHVSNRVSMVLCCGLLLGACTATYRGKSVLQTSLSMGVSCAVCGTACLTSERIANLLICKLDSSNTSNVSSQNRISSHLLGGIAGGGVIGSLFQGAGVLRCMIVFSPIMCSIWYVENSLDNYRRKRIEDILKQQNVDE